MSNRPPGLATAREIAQLLGVSPQTVARLRDKGRLRFTWRRGQRLYFKSEALVLKGCGEDEKQIIPAELTEEAELVVINLVDPRLAAERAQHYVDGPKFLDLIRR